MKGALGLMVVAASIIVVSCGGGGNGGSSSTQFGSLMLTADFQDATRVVPGYADTLRVTVTPPEGIQMPQSAPSNYELTRTSANLEIQGLVPSTAPYHLDMVALTNGTVVGKTTRNVVVARGQSPQVNVSANLQSDVASVAVDGPVQIKAGQNQQLVAYALDANGETLFSGGGFSWTSSDPLTVYVGQDTGLAIARKSGTATVTATLKDTTLSATGDVTVLSASGIEVSISPNPANVAVGKTLQFSATVTGTDNQGVDWSVVEPKGGTITSGGLYTAPHYLGTYTVKATSQADPAISATALVTVGYGQGWSLVYLRAPDGYNSDALCIRDGKIGGAIFNAPQEDPQAALWPNPSAEPIDMSQPGDYWSEVRGIYGDTYVGRAQSDVYGDRPIVWKGVGGSVLYIKARAAHAIFGDWVGGRAQMNGGLHAVLWNITTTIPTAIDLNPSADVESEVWGLDDQQQVGVVDSSPNGFQAALWSGTPESYVNLTPAGGTNAYAVAVYKGEQAGQCQFVDAGDIHAVIWHGTAASIVDLNPAGSGRSRIWGDYDGYQVGQATFHVGASWESQAVVWQGTAASFINLQSYLPAKYSSSWARGVWHDANYVYVVGGALDSPHNHWDAVMWVKPLGN